MINSGLLLAFIQYFDKLYCAGAVAHLGERIVRNDEVASSILVGSTKIVCVSFQNLEKGIIEIPSQEGSYFFIK